MKSSFSADTGILLALTGPFASGKTTLAHALVTKHGFKKCLTATTRPPRIGECDGIDYLFVSPEQFTQMKFGRQFVETATINNHMYGTLRTPIQEGLARNERLVVCIDPTGVRSFMSPENQEFHRAIVSVYIMIDLEEAVRRYKERTPHYSKFDLEQRINTFAEEEQLKHICDCRIENPTGKIDTTVDRLAMLVARWHKQLLTYV